MSRKEQSILILAVTILILFVLNYFMCLPMFESYNENMQEVAVLDEELEKLQLNIQQGEELGAAIQEVDERLAASTLEQYYDENYSVHNFFVDTAQRFGLEVSSLSLSQVGAYSYSSADATGSDISAHPLISGQMTPEEISAVPAYYEVVSQTTSLNVTGTIETILDYVDYLAKDNVYVVIPSLTLSDFVDNFSEVDMSLQFIQYYYQVVQTEGAQTVAY